MAKKAKSPTKKKVTENLISLNEYLSKYNRERVLDTVIKKWYLKKDKSNSKRKKSEWDKMLHEFHNETER